MDADVQKAAKDQPEQKKRGDQEDVQRFAPVRFGGIAGLYVGNDPFRAVTVGQAFVYMVQRDGASAGTQVFGNRYLVNGIWYSKRRHFVFIGSVIKKAAAPQKHGAAELPLPNTDYQLPTTKHQPTASTDDLCQA